MRECLRNSSCRATNCKRRRVLEGADGTGTHGRGDGDGSEGSVVGAVASPLVLDVQCAGTRAGGAAPSPRRRFALPLRSQAPYHPAVPPPRAAPDRPELIFADSTNQIVSVAVAPGPAFSFSASSPLFGIESLVMPPYHQGFAIAPDDKSFIFLEDRSDLGQRGRSAVLTLNWLDGLTSPRLDK